MKIIKNELSDMKAVKQDIDDNSNLPFIPSHPLPIRFSMYIVGAPGSGKTSFWNSLLMNKKNKAYYGFFSKIFLISGSLNTLPQRLLKQLPDHQKYNNFNDELLSDILEYLYDEENDQYLLVLDDVIKDLKKSDELLKTYLNRRHICHNPDGDNKGQLSIITTSQKFSLLSVPYRNSCSHFVIYKCSNKVECDKIRDELMYDLTREEQDEVFELCWSEPYSFLFIDINKDKNNGKYYQKFNKIIFND